MSGGPPGPGPILIVGVGRSGTTLLYRMLCGHEDLAWFSNLTDRWPRFPALAAWSRASDAAALRRFGGRLAPIPSEGYPFWEELTSLDGLSRHGPLSRRDVTDRARSVATSRIAAIRRFQRKPGFVNKATRNVRRLGYLHGLFDGASFVHVVRDPRAVVSSLLEVPFWSDTPVWCEDDVTPRAWAAMGGDETELAARLWARDVERALEDGAALGADRIVEVRYEELVSDSLGTVADVAHGTGLRVTAAFRRRCSSLDVVDRDAASISRLSVQQLDTIGEVAGPVAARIGYAW